MSGPVNLQALDSKEFNKFIDSFDYILSDCDGVLFVPKPDPEAGKWINLMKKLGKKVHFVTTNSLFSRESQEERFKAANIENGYENQTIPSIAIVEYLKSINFNKHVYCLTCPETIDVFMANGIKVKSGPEVAPESYLGFQQYLDDDLEIGAVVFDLDLWMNLAKIHQAITYLRRDDVLFITGATDRHGSFRSGTLSLMPPVFTDIVAKEVNRTPMTIAKPDINMAEFAMRRAGIPKEDKGKVLFIGDMIDQDIKLGKVAGFQTLLVLTNTTLEKMRAHEIKPDYYAENLPSLLPQVEKIINEV